MTSGHTVTITPSEAHVEVRLDGELLAKSDRPLRLAETGLPDRWYLPPADVRMDLLRKTSFQTTCPFKGEASYWSADIGGTTHDGIVWAYETPIDAAADDRRLPELLPDAHRDHRQRRPRHRLRSDRRRGRLRGRRRGEELLKRVGHQPEDATWRLLVFGPDSGCTGAIAIRTETLASASSADRPARADTGAGSRRETRTLPFESLFHDRYPGRARPPSRPSSRSGRRVGDRGPHGLAAGERGDAPGAGELVDDAQAEAADALRVDRRASRGARRRSRSPRAGSPGQGRSTRARRRRRGRGAGRSWRAR